MNKMLSQLRQAMASFGIDAYIIVNTDPHGSEYIPASQMAVKALSGFTGDNAVAVVAGTFAGIWTDSRFFVSGALELQDSGFQLMKDEQGSRSGFIDFLCQLPKGSVAALDGTLISQRDFCQMKRKLDLAGIAVRNDVDLVPQFWHNRPDSVDTDIFVIGDSYAGQAASGKISSIAAQMEAMEISHLIITRLDEIAWLLNIRASDIDYCPLLRSFLLISRQGQQASPILFARGGRLAPHIEEYLSSIGVILRPYGDIYAFLSKLPGGDSVQADFASANSRLISSINPKCRIQDRKSPVQIAKAIKCDAEIRNLSQAMLIDGLAMERFFYKMEQLAGTDFAGVTELSLARMLLAERAKGRTFISESFQCISAFNEHAAMPHYAPSEASSLDIKPGGVYLVDSGGQYLLGTTDITRTIPTGKFSDDFATDYTLVLMGNIELAMAIFPEGTTGHQIDSLARMHLWRHGRNFGHGTGHGVGYCLCCHEGPHSISSAVNPTPLRQGMIVTDEPGIYIEGQYGIRTENMLRVERSQYEGFLKFNVMTLCHIDTRPVRKEMMTQPQIDFLNEYNERVFRELSPHLSAAEAQYLRLRTMRI